LIDIGEAVWRAEDGMNAESYGKEDVEMAVMPLQ
jgi:hypothetical protein